jgi:hypothetical protein
MQIRTIPSKVILGAMEFGQYGDSTARFKFIVEGMAEGNKLTNIDCSQASGVHVISQQRSGSRIIVELEANKQQLISGEHFGAFIRKAVRLETDCPQQPQYVVPIIGWLDINRSSRDFSKFVFQGTPRWQGPWATPNVAGAILASVAIFLTGGTGWLQTRFSQSNYLVPIVCLCMTISTEILVLWFLGLTYSREAWLAFSLGCSAMAVGSPRLRWPSLGAIGMFAALICYLPHGVQRLESYSQLGGDLSIANRLKLWCGALQMMADHPFTGVGVGNFSSVFERDYQDFSHTAQTSTAVNDYLTIGAEHGLFFLSAVVGPLLLLLAWSFHHCRKLENPPLSVMAALLVSLMISSCFSTLWPVPTFKWMALATLVGLIWLSLIPEFRRSEVKPFAFRVLLQSSKWTVSTTLVLFFAGSISLTVLPTRFSSQEIAGKRSELVRYAEIEPRWTKPKGTIIYLSSLSDEAALRHSTLRPLAAMGWRVIPISSRSDPASVHDLIDVIRDKSPSGNIFIAGETIGGKLAWKIAATESPEVVRAGAGFDFLSAEMDDPKENCAPRQPFLVYQSLYSDGVSSNPAICARHQIEFKGMPLRIVLCSDITNHFSTSWIMFLTTLSTFFDHEISRR